LQGPSYLNLSKYKAAASLFGDNIFEPLLFNNGTTIALFIGACFDRVQEDVL